MTTRDVLAAGRLPRHEAERLFMKVTGRTRSEIVAGIPLDDATAAAYSVLCRRRVAGEPLQYIEGTVPFAMLELAVDRRVLIPRPETEYLWELAATIPEQVPDVVVDLCTGSGALALGLAKVYPTAEVIASDISSDALDVAHANAIANNLTITLCAGDLFEALPARLLGNVDLFVANPPYVSTEEVDVLPSEVADWEPGLALAGGDDGLDFVRRIVSDVGVWLAPAGWFFIEVGSVHAKDVMALIPDYLTAEVRRDLTGRDRYVIGQKQ